MPAFLRNLLFFAMIALAISACGGGGAGISSDNGSNSGTGNPVSSSTGSVTLKWTAPTTWADNTAASLSNISGYHLYYGPSATNTPNVINITDGTATQYTLSLPSGTYYFRISAVDSNGHAGLMSTALQKTL